MENEKEQPFIIRTYSKAEMARLYNPSMCITLALQTLARWMRMNTALMDELNLIGYNKYRRAFTPAEVRIIIKFLGEP